MWAVTQVNLIQPRYVRESGLPIGDWAACYHRSSNEHMQSMGSPGWLRTAHTHCSHRNLRDPSSWVEPNALGNQQAVSTEVGGAHRIDEAGQFQWRKGALLYQCGQQRLECRLRQQDATTDQRETTDHRPQVPPKLSRLRWKLGQKAKREPKFRFYALYGHLLREDVLQTAWSIVSDAKGAQTPGVDGTTVHQIECADGGPHAFLAQIHQELSDKSYLPNPVKRINIPKPDGSTRPLGIPTIRDRVVQTAVLLILEPIFEADFMECSHGFRPGRGAHGAVEKVKNNVWSGYREIYDADLKGYFDSIPHEKLIKGLESRVSDRSMLSLIRKFLRAPVQEGSGPPRGSKRGTPQGGVISPLLANSFLHWFDRAF